MRVMTVVNYKDVAKRFADNLFSIRNAVDPVEADT